MPGYHNLKEGMDFVGIIKKEKIARSICYIIFNFDGLINDISACNFFIYKF